MNVTLNTFYEVECYRQGQLVWEDSFHNIVVTQGKNLLLDVMFRLGGAANAWFVGLVNNASFTGYNVVDTAASHAGWLEATGYSQATRPAYVAGVAALGSMSNVLSRAIFSINASATIQGAFMSNSSTKGGAGGSLYGVGSFFAPRTVIIGDDLSVKITLTD
jgi:hypothetical protein